MAKKNVKKVAEGDAEEFKNVLSSLDLSEDQVLLIRSKSPFSYADLTVLDEVVRDRCAGLFVIPHWVDFDLVTPKVIEEVFLNKIEVFREQGGKRTETMEFKCSQNHGKKKCPGHTLEMTVDGEQCKIVLDGKDLGEYNRNFLKALMLLVLLF
jgi:hypothetical protein